MAIDFSNLTKMAMNQGKGVIDKLAKGTGTHELPEYKDSGFAIPGAVKPQESAALKTAFDNQFDAAKAYEKSLKSRGDTIFNTYAEQARNQLPSLIQGVREDYNSRGLLRSGKAKTSEARTVGDLNASLGQKRAEINQGLASNLARMENNAFQTAGLMAQPGAQTALPQLQGIGTQLMANAGNDALTAGLVSAMLGGGAAFGGAGLAGAMQSQGGYSDPYGVTNRGGANLGENPYRAGGGYYL